MGIKQYVVAVLILICSLSNFSQSLLCVPFDSSIQINDTNFKYAQNGGMNYDYQEPTFQNCNELKNDRERLLCSERKLFEFIDKIDNNVKVITNELGIYENLFVQFEIDNEGKVINPMILESKSGNKDICSEFLKVMDSIPNFNPGIRNGIPFGTTFRFNYKYHSSIVFPPSHISENWNTTELYQFKISYPDIWNFQTLANRESIDGRVFDLVRFKLYSEDTINQIIILARGRYPYKQSLKAAKNDWLKLNAEDMELLDIEKIKGNESQKFRFKYKWRRDRPGTIIVQDLYVINQDRFILTFFSNVKDFEETWPLTRPIMDSFSIQH